MVEALIDRAGLINVAPARIEAEARSFEADCHERITLRVPQTTMGRDTADFSQRRSRPRLAVVDWITMHGKQISAV